MKRPPKEAFPPAPETKCVECGRVFDLKDEDDAEEWYYGHDCEDTNED